MRGAKLQGRFNLDYESKSMYEGIAEDLGATVGVEVDYFRWQDYFLDDQYRDILDDVYDVSSSGPGLGRRWMLPFKLPVVMAQLMRGGNQMNERGFYTVDTLRIVLNAGDAERLIPTVLKDEPNNHIKDRIVYRGQVFTPTRVNPRGHFGYRFAVVTIDCQEVSPEELVNDPQFMKYATPAKRDPRNDIYGYGLNGYGDGTYGD
jgi:hypothetical protein